MLHYSPSSGANLLSSYSLAGDYVNSPQSSSMKAKAIAFIRAHKLSLFFLFSWLILLVLWLIPNWSEGPFYFVFISTIFLIIVGSQVFWVSLIGKVGRKLISRKGWRAGLALAGSPTFFCLPSICSRESTGALAGICARACWKLRSTFGLWVP